ncbi:response regulator transcription factor [Kribbella sp. CA-253562]|uniref:response regulator transcription factor n=1 Tax=Kribbella sp. CA-253562 TaxID=3239942 RepID=UPI003D8B30DF
MQTAHDNELGEQQRQLLRLMAQGFPDTTIARRLSLGPRTLARRISELYAVLGVETRFQAGAAAERLGLLAPARPVRAQRHLAITPGTARRKVS